MRVNSLLVMSMLLPAPTVVLAGETTFVTGSRPWNFSGRSRENSLAIQQGGKASLSPQTSSAGGAAPTTSTSYAIGSWVQIEMKLGDGSEGLIMLENHQTNNGNQQAVSSALGDLIESLQQQN